MKINQPSPSTPLKSSPRSAATPDRQFLGSPLSCLSSKNKGACEGSRLLVTVYVLGSAGPLKMVVGEDDNVGDVILSALKRYAREGRHPILGLKAAEFDLHCTCTGSGPLGYTQDIKSCGSRSFILCRKPTSLEEKKPQGSNIGKLWKMKRATSLNLARRIFSP